MRLLERPLRLFVVAGEASGDLLGAELVRALRALGAELEVRGMGGPALQDAGMECLVNAADVSVVGLVEVLRHLPVIRRSFRRLEQEIRSWQPDAVVLIDFPDFNLRLARAIRPSGVPILYYVSPQIWAWRRGRIHLIKRVVDHMLVLFPFEEALYRDAGVPVTFVGHPLVDRIPGQLEGQTEAGQARAAGSTSEQPVVALLPGSRSSEIRALMPVMIDAAGALANRMPGARFFLAQAPTIRTEELMGSLHRAQVPIEVVRGRTLEVLAAADVALVASGTATLEAALSRVPMVVVYRVSWITYLIARLLIRGISSISLVNLVAGRRVVPERIQRLRPFELAGLLEQLLQDSTRQEEMKAQLDEVRALLGEPGASRRAATVVLRWLERRAGG